MTIKRVVSMLTLQSMIGLISDAPYKAPLKV
jgi:hypothetical protein